MDAQAQRAYLRIALAAQALLRRLDTLTAEELAQGGDRAEREALRQALYTPEEPVPSEAEDGPEFRTLSQKIADALTRP